MELLCDLVDEVIKPALTQSMRDVSLAFRNRVCPRQPVEHKMSGRLDAEIYRPEEPPQALLETVHALHQPRLQRAIAVGIKIAAQRLFQDVGLGRLLRASGGLEPGKQRGIEAEVDARFHRAARECVGKTVIGWSLKGGFLGVIRQAPGAATNVPPRAMPA